MFRDLRRIDRYLIQFLSNRTSGPQLLLNDFRFETCHPFWDGLGVIFGAPGRFNRLHEMGRDAVEVTVCGSRSSVCLLRIVSIVRHRTTGNSTDESNSGGVQYVPISPLEIQLVARLLEDTVPEIRDDCFGGLTVADSGIQ